MHTDQAWYVVLRVVVGGGGGGMWGVGAEQGGIEQEGREHKQQDKALWIMSSHEKFSYNRTCQEHCQYDVVIPSSLIKHGSTTSFHA